LKVKKKSGAKTVPKLRNSTSRQNQKERTHEVDELEPAGQRAKGGRTVCLPEKRFTTWASQRIVRHCNRGD